jgi:hypothetical protein
MRLASTTLPYGKGGDGPYGRLPGRAYGYETWRATTVLPFLVPVAVTDAPGANEAQTPPVQFVELSVTTVDPPTVNAIVGHTPFTLLTVPPTVAMPGAGDGVGDGLGDGEGAGPAKSSAFMVTLVG